MANRPSVQEFVSRWQAGTGQGQAKYTQGIQGTNDWAERALAAADARNAGLQRAIADGSIDRGISNLGSSGWKNKTLAKGPQNWAAGVAAATPAMTAGAQKLYGMLDQAMNALNDLPRGGLEQNIARSAAFSRAMNAAKNASK